MNEQNGRAGHRFFTFGLTTAVVLAATAMVGCAGTESADLTEPESVTVADSETEDSFDELARRLQEGVETPLTLSIDGVEEEPLITIAARPEGIPADVNPLPGGVEGAEPAVESAAEVTDVEVVSETEAVEEENDGLASGSGEPASQTLEQQIENAVWALRGVLREAGDQDLSPLGRMLQVALLESVHPGVFEAELGPFDEAAGSAGLTDDERSVLALTLDLASSLRDEMEPGLVDIDKFADAVEEASTAIRAMRTLSIDDARLCLRVDNFGVYREIERHDQLYKFIAGRAHPVIVYCELDHFSRRPANRDGVDGYVVNVRQALEIYRVGTEKARDSESTLVWQMDAQPVVDFSRRPLRDFFIVQVIELPDNLSVGSYRMKIIATDVATGDEVERSIDFDLVANANALRGPGFAKNNRPGQYDPDRYNPDR